MAEPTTGLSPLTEPVCGSSTDKPSIPLIDSSPVLPTPISNNEPMATVDGDDDVLGFIRPLQVYSRREAPAPKPVFVQDSNQASGAERARGVSKEFPRLRNPNVSPLPNIVTIIDSPLHPFQKKLGSKGKTLPSTRAKLSVRVIMGNHILPFEIFNFDQITRLIHHFHLSNTKTT
ncbi:hypothetical protein QYF36_022087 [Acer negundo]|nr:hypothetical protein QYF36_022087 [Acer negundo]